MKRKILTNFGMIFVLLIILIAAGKIYEFIILERVDNRYYSVIKISDAITSRKNEIILNGNIVKYIIKENDKGIYCEWINFDSDEQHSIDLKESKVKHTSDLVNQMKKVLLNTPKVLLDIFYKDNNLNIINLLKIKYIIPIKYNDENCYKIVAGRKVLIVSRETFLPICEYNHIVNSKLPSKGQVEYIYEFKPGIVTDEDVSLPDLSQYTIIDE